MNLAAKYRPKTFDDVTEQKVVVDIVRNICESKNMSNRNFLFVGSAGCGKTTLGRIIANELNEGSGGIIEIDAASHSGVDDMRQLVEQAKQYPVGTNYKVFIVDECHSLSPNAWQVALKCIEEQPAKSVFIWCTTNPEKIPGTILSRVQMFQLSKISLPGIFNRLKYIVEKENEEGANITCTDGALSYIAKLAQGGMRDAITLLDKSLAYTHTINEENLQEALGLPDYTDYFAMLNAVVKKDNASIIAIINKVYNSGVNFNRWFEGFFGFIVNIVKYIYTQDIECTMIPGTYRDKLAGYTTKHAYVCLKLSNTLAKLNKDLKASPYPQEIAISCLCSQEAVK